MDEPPARVLQGTSAHQPSVSKQGPEAPWLWASARQKLFSYKPKSTSDIQIHKENGLKSYGSLLLSREKAIKDSLNYTVLHLMIEFNSKK